jgi:hypothetical protein
MSTDDTIAETRCTRCGKVKRDGDEGERQIVWRRYPHAPAQRLETWKCGECCYQAAANMRSLTFRSFTQGTDT